MASSPFTPARIAILVFIVTITVVLVFHSHFTAALDTLKHDSCSPAQSSHQAHPEAKRIATTFPAISPLEALGPEGDEAWERIVPSRGGFIWVQYNETYDVPYGISMFHGLHCLQMLRGAFKQQLGVSGHGHDHHDGGDISTKHEHGGHFDKVHLGHCLGYVAEVCTSNPSKSIANFGQMLQCVGDSTIERPWIEYDERTGDILHRGVDGTVGQHQCRDTRHLWAAAESTEDGGMRAWNYAVDDTVERVFGNL
jgi:hypothetical protein